MEQWIIKSKSLPKGILKFSELLCGCGSPEECWLMLHNYLKVCFLYNAPVPSQFNLEQTGNLFFAYVIYTQCELTEHGINIEYSWLTEEGNICLDWLNANIDKVEDMIVDYSDAHRVEQ